MTILTYAKRPPALGATWPRVSGHQGTYDLATAKGSLAVLAVCHWRGQRFSAGVQAVAEALCAADQAAEDADEDATGSKASALVRMWDLAVAAAAAAQALFGFLASVTIDDADTDSVAALDAATALLMHTGEQAQRLRADIGLDGGTDPR